MSKKCRSKVKLPYIDARGDKPDFKGLVTKALRALEIESRLYGSEDYYDFWFGPDGVGDWEHAAQCVVKYQQGYNCNPQSIGARGHVSPMRYGGVVPIPKKVVGSNNKRGVRGSKKRSKPKKAVGNRQLWESGYVDSYRNNEVDDDISQDGDITIYFYRDVNQNNDVEIFTSLHAFDAFLDKEGIFVDDEALRVLMNSDWVFCAVDPMLEKYSGDKSLVCEASYGALCWECGATSASS